MTSSIDTQSNGSRYKPDAAFLKKNSLSSLAARIAMIDDPVMKAASATLRATPDEVLEWAEKKRAAGFSDEEIGNQLESLTNSHGDLEPDTGNALVVKSANAWIEQAKAKPIPKRLFGDLEFQGETIVVFGDTGSNKSTLAVQICDDVTASKNTLGLPCEVAGLKSLYNDLELSDKQFEGRYSDNYTNHYRFSDNFDRSEFNRDCVLPPQMDYERYVLLSMEAAIAEKGAGYNVIDNITALKAATEKAHDAGPFMNEINRLARKYGCTNKILCHTPKRDPSRPISINDLAGSKVLSNLADSVYAIGKSYTDPSIRYIKQLKVRSVDLKYDANNVILYRVIKPSNFLGLEFLGYGVERDHLAQAAPSDAGGKRLREAVEFLQNILRDGPVPADEVKKKAEDAGIALVTLQRASVQMEIEKKWGEWSLKKS